MMCCVSVTEWVRLTLCHQVPQKPLAVTAGWLPGILKLRCHLSLPSPEFPMKHKAFAWLCGLRYWVRSHLPSSFPSIPWKGSLHAGALPRLSLHTPRSCTFPSAREPWRPSSLPPSSQPYPFPSLSVSPLFCRVFCNFPKPSFPFSIPVCL